MSAAGGLLHCIGLLAACSQGRAALLVLFLAAGSRELLRRQAQAVLYFTDCCFPMSCCSCLALLCGSTFTPLRFLAFQAYSAALNSNCWHTLRVQCLSAVCIDVLTAVWQGQGSCTGMHMLAATSVR